MYLSTAYIQADHELVFSLSTCSEKKIGGLTLLPVALIYV